MFGIAHLQRVAAGTPWTVTRAHWVWSGPVSDVANSDNSEVLGATIVGSVDRGSFRDCTLSGHGVFEWTVPVKLDVECGEHLQENVEADGRLSILQLVEGSLANPCEPRQLDSAEPGLPAMEVDDLVEMDDAYLLGSVFYRDRGNMD